MGEPDFPLQFCAMHRPYTPTQQYDLVTAAYVLSELAGDAERRQVIQELWERTKGILVLVEPGTPSGYQYIINAREQVCGMSGQFAYAFAVTRIATHVNFPGKKGVRPERPCHLPPGSTTTNHELQCKTVRTF